MPLLPLQAMRNLQFYADSLGQQPQYYHGQEKEQAEMSSEPKAFSEKAKQSMLGTSLRANDIARNN